MEFGGDIGADYVLDADFSGFDLAGFEKLGHRTALLLGYCFVFLLDHAETGNGKLELNFELRLEGRVSEDFGGKDGRHTIRDDEGAMIDGLCSVVRWKARNVSKIEGCAAFDLAGTRLDSGVDV